MEEYMLFFVSRDILASHGFSFVDVVAGNGVEESDMSAELMEHIEMGDVVAVTGANEICPAEEPFPLGQIVAVTGTEEICPTEEPFPVGQSGQCTPPRVMEEEGGDDMPVEIAAFEEVYLTNAVYEGGPIEIPEEETVALQEATTTVPSAVQEDETVETKMMEEDLIPPVAHNEQLHVEEYDAHGERGENNETPRAKTDGKWPRPGCGLRARPPDEEHANFTMRRLRKKENPKILDCKDCGQTFTNRGTLLTHKENIHLKTHYRCTKCNEKASTKSNMYRHIRKMHEIEGKNQKKFCIKIVQEKEEATSST